MTRINGVGFLSEFFDGELYPNAFGRDKEVPNISLKNREVVVVLNSISVKLAPNSNKGIRTVEVRRLTPEDFEIISKDSRAYINYEPISFRPGFLTLKRTIRIGLITVSDTIEVPKEQLRIKEDWRNINLSAAEGICFYNDVFLKSLRLKVPDILEVVFGFNIELEIKLLREFEEASRLKEAEDLKIEHARRVKIFFEFNPEAISWFNSTPSWEEICQEMFVRKLTVRVDSTKLWYWERAEEVWTHWHSFKIGDEEFKFPAETTIVDRRFI